jgi:hypothetical protein
MTIETQTAERLRLRLSENEIGHWNNALNEVCNGFVVENFQAAIGIPATLADALLQRMHRMAPGEAEDFSVDEILALRNALTAVMAELEPGEFHSRMGFTVEESRQMRNSLDAMAGQMRVIKTA